MVKVQWDAGERRPPSLIIAQSIPHFKCPKDTEEW